MEKTEVVNKVAGPICTKPNMPDRYLRKGYNKVPLRVVHYSHGSYEAAASGSGLK
jgi:hypothetical protein